MLGLFLDRAIGLELRGIFLIYCFTKVVVVDVDVVVVGVVVVVIVVNAGGAVWAELLGIFLVGGFLNSVADIAVDFFNVGVDDVSVVAKPCFKLLEGSICCNMRFIG